MLKVDIYVRVVLTVIAISLAVIAFRPVFNTPAVAQSEIIDVNIAEVDGRRASFGRLRVTVEEWDAGTLEVQGIYR